ncbi:MAG: PEGA domain-containing protein [Polyangia bacterium]|jgi:hypothetical protein|nr:PEGA domain-containing protein [Polyangia bacterium]
MRNWILSAVMLGLLGASAPRAAWAQQYVPEAQKRKARVLQQKAIFAYRTKKFEAAVKHFLSAYEAWPRRELHFNIALSYGRLGDKINAVTYLRRFVKDASARELASIPKWLKDIDEEVAVVNIQGPPGAVVTMDGKEVGQVPLELVLMPGMHLFVVTLEGRRIAKRDWDITPGLRKVWEVVEAVERPREPERPRDVTPPVVIVQPPPVKEKPIHMAVTITVSVLAVALAGAAAGTGMKAKSLHDDYKANPTVETRNDGILMRNMTNGLWGAVGAVALTAGILAIFTKWTKSKERSAALPRLEIGVDQGGASVSLSGQF